MILNGPIYKHLQSSKKLGKKLFAVLVDPDELKLGALKQIVALANTHGVDYFFVGGSLILDDQMNRCLSFIRENSSIPIVLFPGSSQQIHDGADGFLLLSLISGRNPELLIGQHVLAAPYLRQTDLEVLSTGYMLIDGGAPTTASYISNTQPIPADKPGIAACTAMAGEMLGLKLLYMDAGSGAKQPVPMASIAQVSKSVSCPIIVGGGIRDAAQAVATAKAGADLIVVGNVIEKDPTRLREIVTALHSFPIKEGVS